MSIQINTEAELHEAAAEALATQDEDTLLELRQIAGEWLRPENERQALDSLLDSMIEAVDLIKQLNEDAEG